MLDAPCPPDLCFVAFGDVEDRVTGLRDLIAEVGRRAAPAFGVILGDTVEEPARPRYRLLVDAIARSAPSFPIRLVPGNRDDADAGDLFREHLGPRTWWFQERGTLFVGLDNARGPLTSESLGTIAVAGKDVERVVVFAHQPFHVAGESGPDARIRRERLGALRCAFGGRRIDAVFAGHLDLYQTCRDDQGTVHAVNGHVQDPQSGNTVPTAVLVRIGRAGVRVDRVQVPYRVDAADSLRRFVAGAEQFAMRLTRRRTAAV